MKKLRSTGRFKRDYKRILKRGWNTEKLANLVQKLRMNAPLPSLARPHKLAGEWLGFWECHIEPDWLFIYDVTVDTVLLAGTGSHDDLFK